MLHHIMEEQCSPLGWSYYYQEEGFEELKQSLLYSTLELEAAVVSAQEEISRKDDEIAQLKGLLAKIVEERDDFRVKYQRLILDKQTVFQQVHIQGHSSKQLLECPNTTTSNQDDNIGLSPSYCNDDNNDEDNNNNNNSNNKSLVLAPTSPKTPRQSPIQDVSINITPKRPLPEKGKFLQAVMEAGPLLQTLLLAGPLPQWQHPPPQLSSIDIPPVTISSPKMKILHQDSACLISPTTGGFSNKRPMISGETSDLSPNSKYQKVCSPIIIDPNI